jgi:hypothetical protein
MTSGYITCFKGRLTAESTLIVDGAEWPIPELPTDGPRATMLRVETAVAAAGYRVLETMREATSNYKVDGAGGYSIELVKR